MVVFKELEKDLISMVIAMKMQGSNLISMVITMKMQGYKHILWECAVPQWTTGDRFGADFTARPQLPQERRQQATGPVHWSNRFKNQIIWSYKTLPAGAIHKAEVRQQPLKGGHGLCLCSSINEASAKVAKIWICFLSSQPILQEDSAIQGRCKAKSRVNYSNVVYQSFSSEQQASYNATNGLDQAEKGTDMGMPNKQRPWVLGKTSITTPQNIKEKVVAWLGKFKVSEEVVDSRMSPSWRRI